MSDPAEHSTLTGPELKSGAAWLASAAPEEVDEFLSGLSQNALLALPWVFEFWALPHQLAPRGAWKTWVIMGGRGAGKTRAGSEWVRMQVEGAGPADPGKCKRVALVGETIDQVRDVMVLRVPPQPQRKLQLVPGLAALLPLTKLVRPGRIELRPPHRLGLMRREHLRHRAIGPQQLMLRRLPLRLPIRRRAGHNPALPQPQ